MSSTGSGEASTDYAGHWSKWHEEHEGTEWHVAYKDIQETLRPFLEPLLGAVAGEPCPQILDIGCGTSSWGLELLVEHPEAELTLVDVSESLIALLKEQHGSDPRVHLHVGDCRDLEAIGINRGSCALILDKGTMDALHQDDEKAQMLRGASALLRRPAGLLVSISFASAARVMLLRRMAAELRLKLHMHVIKSKSENRLVSLLAETLDDAALDAMGDRKLTDRVLDRLLYAGPLRSERLIVFENKALASSIVVEQEVGVTRGDADSTGCIVWPSAHSMCAHLCAHPELVRGKRVVELGAGTGLVGLVAAALGASELVLTDLAQGLPLLQRNVERNIGAFGSLRPRVEELAWGVEAAKAAAPHGCDVVIGCEVIYQHDDDTSIALADTMHQLAGKEGRCLMAYEFRAGLMQDLVFFDRANELFEVDVESLVPYGFGIEEGEVDEDRILYTYRLKEAC